MAKKDKKSSKEKSTEKVASPEPKSSRKKSSKAAADEPAAAAPTAVEEEPVAVQEKEKEKESGKHSKKSKSSKKKNDEVKKDDSPASPQHHHHHLEEAAAVEEPQQAPVDDEPTPADATVVDNEDAPQQPEESAPVAEEETPTAEVEEVEEAQVDATADEVEEEAHVEEEEAHVDAPPMEEVAVEEAHVDAPPMEEVAVEEVAVEEVAVEEVAVEEEKVVTPTPAPAAAKATPAPAPAAKTTAPAAVSNEQQKKEAEARAARTEELRTKARADAAAAAEAKKAEEAAAEAAGAEAKAKAEADAAAAAEAKRASFFTPSTPAEAYENGLQCFLGTTEGVQREPEAAFRLLTQAADSGAHPLAHVYLGKLHWSGEGVEEVSYSEAVGAYRKAAASKSGDVLQAIGVALRDGDCAFRNATGSAAVLREASAAGNAAAGGVADAVLAAASAEEKERANVFRWLDAGRFDTAYTAHPIGGSISGDGFRFEWSAFACLSAAQAGRTEELRSAVVVLTRADGVRVEGKHMYWVGDATPWSQVPELKVAVPKAHEVVGHVLTARARGAFPLMCRINPDTGDQLLYINDDAYLANESRFKAAGYTQLLGRMGFVFKAVATPGEPLGPCAANTFADGPGLSDAVQESKPTEFTIHSMDANGNPVTVGGALDDFSIVVAGPDGTPLAVEVEDLLNGSYLVKYTPTDSGNHTVTLKYKDEDIKDSPATVAVRPCPCADNCTANGRGLEDGQDGKKSEFTVVAVDKNNEPLKVGGDADGFAVSVKRGDVDVPCSLADNGDGTYACAFTPDDAAEHTIEVRYLDQPIRGMPATVTVRPAPSAENTYADGAGLVEGQATKPSEFVVHCVDKNGAPLTAGGDLPDFSISVAGPEGDVPVESTDNGDGTYTCTYTPTGPGDFDIAVAYCGVPIRDMPTCMRIKAAPDAAQSYAEGPGLLGAFDNEPATFRVVLVDTTGVQRVDGGDDVAVTVVSKDGAHTVAPTIVDNNDGTYAVEYSAEEPAEYAIAVLCEGKHVRDSPFSVAVSEGTDASNCGFGAFTFTVQAHDKRGKAKTFGGDDFKVSVALKGAEEGSSADAEAVDNQDGTYTAKYSLEGAGKFMVHVKLNGKAIKGSPFQQKM